MTLYSALELLKKIASIIGNINTQLTNLYTKIGKKINAK